MLLKNFYKGEKIDISINHGGDFNHYFVNADSGISGKKDSVIVTSGLHQLGTDGIWGKCLYKASSVAIPYAFALSRAVCEATTAKFASVGVYTKYGQKQAGLFLADIDSRKFYQYKFQLSFSETFISYLFAWRFMIFKRFLTWLVKSMIILLLV